MGSQGLTLVARQPILDAAGRVHAHELLFRGDDDARMGGGERATAAVLVTTFLGGDIDAVTGGRPAWVNVSREFLLAVDPLPMAPGQVVLELLEDQLVDRPLLDRLEMLRLQGYSIALDDFEWRPGVEELVRLATHVKLDLRALGADGFARHARLLADSGVTLVAEKVETAEEASAAVELGATLLQGFHFARPELTGVRALTGERIAGARSAVTLCARADFDEVERALRADPALSVRVLSYLNSVAAPTAHRVSSIRQALVLVGPRTVAQWAATLLLSDLAEHRRAALGIALLRAALCERLAGSAREEGFVVGMLSALDALFGVPVDEIVSGLPLADTVSEAVLEERGPLGAVLASARRIAEGAGARTAQETSALRAALVWADAALPPQG